jgi:hypothetical protein
MRPVVANRTACAAPRGASEDDGGVAAGMSALRLIECDARVPFGEGVVVPARRAGRVAYGRLGHGHDCAPRGRRSPEGRCLVRGHPVHVKRDEHGPRRCGVRGEDFHLWAVRNATARRFPKLCHFVRQRAELGMLSHKIEIGVDHPHVRPPPSAPNRVACYPSGTIGVAHQRMQTCAGVAHVRALFREAQLDLVHEPERLFHPALVVKPGEARPHGQIVLGAAVCHCVDIVWPRASHLWGPRGPIAGIQMQGSRTA